jgi:hypothetical protein
MLFKTRTVFTDRAFVTNQAVLTITLFISLLFTVGFAKAAVLNFQTTNQSMWQSGTAGGLNESIFVGTTWDTPTAQIGAIIGNVIQTPGIPPLQITPAIPRQLITPAIPRKLIVSSKRICIPFAGCYRTPAVYSPAIPAVYTPAIPAVYTPAIPSAEIDTRTGAKVDISTQGKVGLEFSVAATAGDVDAEIEFEANLSAPEKIAAFELFELAASSTLLDSSEFQTQFPELSAKAEFILAANLDIAGQACVVPLGCDQGNTNIGFEEFALELISFNENDSGRVRLLGLDELGPSAFNFGDPISVTAGITEVGNVTVFVPDVETTGTLGGNSLISQGEADLLDIKLDIDGILTASSGLPPVLGTGIDAGILSFGYDILDIEFGPVVDIKQTFELIPELFVDLSFSESVFIEGLADKVSFLSAAVNDLPRIALGIGQNLIVDTQYRVDAKLRNTTSLGIDGEFDLDVLVADFSLNALGTTFDLGELGPLFNFNERFGIAELPPIFEREFGLGGFNQVAGESLRLSTMIDEQQPGEIPEAKLANAVAVLVTGSPVEMSQMVDKPTVDSFVFSFDYLFGQAGSILDVYLGDYLLTSIESFGGMSSFATFSGTFDTNAVFGSFDMALLKFIFNSINGEAGHTLLIDNVVLPNLVNGNFDLAAVTGVLSNWQTSVPIGSNGSVSAFVLEAEVSEPGLLWLLLIGSILIVLRGAISNKASNADAQGTV